MGIWAFGRRAGLYAGLVIGTCIGLFLFTRILIPDVMLTLAIALGMWGFLRAIDKEEPHPRLWAFIFAASLGTGLLLKSLIAVVFPVGAAIVYLFLTGQLFNAKTWKRLHPVSGVVVLLLIAAPWHILATIRNPPYFAWTLHSGPGEYHGFLWFFFINEQLLRFLNLRYPHDYNTVPRLWFWLFHLIWLFPWSVYLPAIAKLSFRPVDRAGRTRLLALCWIGFIMIFFTFSTTQEYYSMPAYPAMALLLGCAIADGGVWIKRGTRVLTVICAICAIAALAILFMVRGLPAPGDIFSALNEHPSVYTLIARTHGRPDACIVRLSALAAAYCRDCLSDRSTGNNSREETGIRCGHADDGVVFPRSAIGHGDLRSVPLIKAAGEGPGSLAARHADH